MALYLGNQKVSPLTVMPPTAQLHAPVLVKGVTTYTLQNPSSNGSYPTGYNIFIDGVLYKSVDKAFTAGESITLDYVDNMSAFTGKHTLTATLKSIELKESEKAIGIDFSIFTITQTLTNMSSTNSTQFMYQNDAYVNTLSANEGFYLPSDIILTMAGVNIIQTNYNDYTGKISIQNLAGDLIITANADTTNKLRVPYITLKEKDISMRTVKNATNYFLYMNGQQVWTTEVTLPTFTVEQVSDTATQQFELNAKDYYESKCQKIASGWSLCKVVFSGNGSAIFHCISNGESGYDYGIISNVNQTLASSNVDDGATGSTKVKKNFKGESSTEVKDVVFDSISDGDFIMCKYRKDGSGDQGFDSLQFQIEVGF